MKLETKYGVLEGTVEEFKELLEGKNLKYFKGKVTLAYTLNPRRYKVVCEEEEAEREVVKSGYYIVNKDDARCLINSGRHVPKGLVLKHVFVDRYIDTIGTEYILHESDLDGYNMSWVDGKFKSFKDKKLLLVQKEEYKVVKEDIYSYYNCNIVLKKGTVLLETEYNYEDSLGIQYHLSSDTIENKLEGVYGDSVTLHFEEHKCNNELYKVELP